MIHDTNNYWEQLERLEKLIKASELKAGLIFSFHNLTLGLFIDRIDNFEPILAENKLFIPLSILWIISILISIYYCFMCFRPKFELKYDLNVFFFKDATSKFGSVDEYSKKLIHTCKSEEQIVKQLSQQIHAESVIIDRKFYNVKWAIFYFIISFIFILLMIFTWVIFNIFF